MRRKQQAIQLLWRQCFRRHSSQSTAKQALWGEPKADEGVPQIDLTVNGMPVRVPQGTTIMQACSVVGIDVPRFCYHERLKIAGNCRMCLVQVNGGPKLMASCAAPVGPKMVVETDSQPVKKAREGVMEFLLANHPLDCPICDQGGECDLQEQAMAYGTDRSRFLLEWGDEKRAVEDKEFGPLVKTSMNRCIHCTRCVRFANDIAGFDGLGTTGRGNDMQISTYVHAVSINSELSGNLVDLCPVGALTSKPYAFQARPWELKGTPTIDVMDGMGSAIRVDSRGPEVMRVLPRLNEAINEEWLGDKSRFACDGLRNQRLMSPLLRTENGLEECDWERALSVAAQQLRQVRPEEIKVVAGPFVDVETLVAMKDFMVRLGVDNLALEHSADAANIVDIPSAYRFNAGIAGIEEADRILIIGANPRKEAPVLNARIRKAYLAKPSLTIGYIGEDDAGVDADVLTYKTVNLGKRILEGGIESIQAFFEGSQKPMLIVGEPALVDGQHRYQLGQVVRALGERLVRSDWNGFCTLAISASCTGAHEIGWTPSSTTSVEPKVVYLLGSDAPLVNSSKPCFTIYQGHHGDIGAQSADLVLPGLAYTEKASMYVNMEGRPQRTVAAVGGPSGARQDWQIIRALAEVSGVSLPFDDEAGLYQRIDEIAPGLLEHFGELPVGSSIIASHLLPKVLLNVHQQESERSVRPLKSRISDYYLTDAISRASPTMAKCSLFNQSSK